jgi:hypothetical protein
MSNIQNQFGGIITDSDIFRHIKSIGYEFETSDLAKLSLEESYLINSGNNTMDMDDEQQFDKNYFTYGITLDLEKDQEIDFMDSSESEGSNLVSSESVGSDPDIDYEYTEYMLEPRPGDGKNTKVAITNDIAKTQFHKMITPKCRGRESQKNSIYMFRTHAGKMYRIKFDYPLRERSCSTFSGLEIVITYYKPKRGPNLILNMFADACERVIEHLSNMKETRGDLFITNKNKNGLSGIGKIPYRKLYNKEGTNLYYLETYDGASTNTRLQFRNFQFKPQMTFCVSIDNAYEVMQQISLTTDKNRKSALRSKRRMNISYDSSSKIMNTIVIPMVQKYNEAINAKGLQYTIDPNTLFGKRMVNYLFLMYIKIDTYLLNYVKQSDEELKNPSTKRIYFKSYLYMLVRHSNFELYSRMKYHMEKNFPTRPKEDIKRLLNLFIYNPKFLSTVYTEIPYIFSKINKSDPDYGDPRRSLKSYFEFFENPADPTKSADWLIYSDTDGESSMYPMKGDDILIENRFFNDAARNYLLNVLGKNSPTMGLRLKDLMDIVAAVKGKSAKDMEMALTNKVINPTTGRLVAKCEDGKVRNDKFRCVKSNTTRAPKVNKRATTRRAKK